MDDILGKEVRQGLRQVWGSAWWPCLDIPKRHVTMSGELWGCSLKMGCSLQSGNPGTTFPASVPTAGPSVLGTNDTDFG